ncbi:hypothetical protein [Gloeocapsopsis crepidinum]|uniref:hypothetical protein n=1 Tax=Gloeocapsopsis crepidinum TaxID=693223 RepID=UPI001D147CF3|nr:hypothetical protein [Gloeocapsopsis crepidinum]
MTITLTDKELTELWVEANHNNLQSEREPFEIFHEMPKRLGKGYERHIEVHPNL